MDIRYAAGLFDGEGCVSITKWHKPKSTHVRYQLRVTLGMTHKPVIEALKDEFGGTIHVNRHDLRNKKHRPQFVWIVASKDAFQFLMMVYPHLIVKKDEAKIALAFQSHVNNTPYIRNGRRGVPRTNYEQIRQVREKMFNDISALKKRTYTPIKSGPIESVNSL